MEAPPRYPPEMKGLSANTIHLVVRESVAETLTGLGFDVANPTALQADPHHLRTLREGREEARRVVRKTLLATAVSALLYALWEGVKGGVRD